MLDRRRFAFDNETFVVDSMVEGRDLRCLRTMSEDFRELASGIVTVTCVRVYFDKVVSNRRFLVLNN